MASSLLNLMRSLTMFPMLLWNECVCRMGPFVFKGHSLSFRFFCRILHNHLPTRCMPSQDHALPKFLDLSSPLYRRAIGLSVFRGILAMEWHCVHFFKGCNNTDMCVPVIALVLVYFSMGSKFNSCRRVETHQGSLPINDYTS
ncbi:hypothetical protein BX666DRAFT_2006572 [Dichotomocladium elegans]|nr:hypothetical protein BX666DRAFT_2006572 [Dichotomocladium elegans]